MSFTLMPARRRRSAPASVILLLPKGIGESEKATLDWFSRQREEWLLLFDNADDTTLSLRSYFPPCSHGNIIITSRNRDACLYAPQSFPVSDMKPEEARDLLLKTASPRAYQRSRTLGTKIVEVHLLSLSCRSIAVTNVY